MKCLEYLERRLEEDEKMTSVELQRLVAQKFGADISAASIRRYLRVSLQWAVVRTRYGSMISDTNKQKRLELPRCVWKIVTIWTTLSGLMSHQYN